MDFRPVEHYPVALYGGVPGLRRLRRSIAEHRLQERPSPPPVEERRIATLPRTLLLPRSL